MSLPHGKLNLLCCWTLLLGGCASSDGFAPARTEHRSALSESQVSELLGFSLAEGISGTWHATELDWNEPPRDGDVTFSPASARTNLLWKFEVPPPDSPHYRIEEVDVRCDRDRINTNTRICDDHLEATLILRLKTEDGALAERIPVHFKMYEPGYAAWAASDVQFSGSLNVAPPSVRVGVFGSIDEHGAKGSLIGDLVTEREREERSETTAGFVFTLAQWQQPVGSAVLLP